MELLAGLFLCFVNNRKIGFLPFNNASFHIEHREPLCSEDFCCATASVPGSTIGNDLLVFVRTDFTQAMWEVVDRNQNCLRKMPFGEFLRGSNVKQNNVRI